MNNYMRLAPKDIFYPFIIMLIVCIVSGCSTPYQSIGYSGGYSNVRLSEDVFRIIFYGNGYTSSHRAADFALLRSAEVAIAYGYRYFYIISEKDQVSSSYHTTPLRSRTTGNFNTRSGNYNSYTVYSGGNTYRISKPSSTNTIFCFNERPTNSSDVFYDAEYILEELSSLYDITIKR